MGLSIDELEKQEQAARQRNPELKAPPLQIEDTIHLPNLFNPETGQYGRDAVVTRLSPSEQIKIAAETGAETNEADLREMRQHCREDINIEELPELRERAWMLVFGCVDPTFTYVQALQWLGRKDANDIVQPILYKINELNERIPALASYQEAIDNVARFPLAMQQLEAAYLAGEDTLRAFLEEDSETVRFIRKWAMTITAAAFSIMQKQAQIQAEATGEATLKQFVDFAIRVGVLSQHE